MRARILSRILALLLPFLGDAGLTLLLYNPLLPLAIDTVLINEVDAETPGTDTAEFIELYDGGGLTNIDHESDSENDYESETGTYLNYPPVQP